MQDNPTITNIEIHEFWYEATDLGSNFGGFNLIYEPGAKRHRTSYALRIRTNQGLCGESVGGGPAEVDQLRMYAHYLIGNNALEWEKIYDDVKRALRKYDKMSMGLVDIALWDLAGKLYDAPIYELLGGYRTKLPAYAST